MEVKCGVCGTINESTNDFCKGCFLPLHKTMEQWTHELEEKVNEDLSQESNEEVKITDETTVLPTIEATDLLGEEVSTEIPLEEVKEVTETSDEEVEPPVKVEDTSNKESEENNDQVETSIETSEEETKKEESNESLTETSKEEKKDDVEVVMLSSINNEEPVEQKIKEEIKHSEHELTPYHTQDITDLRSELEAISLVNHDDELAENEKSSKSLTLKFNIILFALSIVFTTISTYVIKINDITNIVFGILTTILFAGVAIFLTFKKYIPAKKEIDKTYFSIFVTVTVFEIIYRSIMLYLTDFRLVYVYIFVIVLYTLISIMIVNVISRFIKNNKKELEPSKFISKMNIIVLVIISLLVVAGFVTKKTNATIEFGTDVAPTTVPDELYDYVETINQQIVSNIQADENYKIPETVTDVDFVATDLVLDSVNLKIDEYGTVESGEIKYDGTTYRYREKTFIIAQG